MRTILYETTTATEDTKEATGELSGIAFQSSREYQFQIETTGGVEVKEIAYKYETLNTTL
jgi:hypothetical protein